MVKKVKKRILLAVDGSDNALKAVRYATKLTPLKKMEVVLFNVYSKIPEHYWDMEWEPLYGKRIREVHSWDRQREKTRSEYMEKAKQILLRSGFSRDAVTVKIHEREIGIARDIIREAQQEYSAVIVGRKGMSKLKDLVLGSIADKLLKKLDFVPLVVVGENQEAAKVLLALDGSEGAMHAVDCVGSTLGDSEFDVTLIHVIRGKNKGFIEEAKNKMNPVFDVAKEHLIKSEIKTHKVTTKVITGVNSRANAIIGEARKGGYGTIVVGRRGLSRALDFSMGRVSNKVIHMGKKQAVWVVG